MQVMEGNTRNKRPVSTPAGYKPTVMEIWQDGQAEFKPLYKVIYVHTLSFFLSFVLW